MWFVAVISLCGISFLANLFLIYLACNQASTGGLWKRRYEDERQLLFSYWWWWGKCPLRCPYSSLTGIKFWRTQYGFNNLCPCSGKDTNTRVNTKVLSWPLTRALEADSSLLKIQRYYEVGEVLCLALRKAIGYDFELDIVLLVTVKLHC